VIPGKIYRPEDLLEVAWRRRWLVVGPAAVVALCTFIGVALLPDRYRSEALLLIIPPRVPQNLVRSTMTTRLDERLQAIGQELETRSRLEPIIREFDLYPGQRRTMLMDDVVELMRRDVVFSPPRIRRSDADAGSFTVSFTYGDPRVAMVVTEKLASLFVSENIEDRTGLAEQTDKFLESQLDETRVKLVESEKRLEEFRRTRPGLMPSEMQNNQQALSNAQMQLQAVQESLNRDREAQLLNQRQIANMQHAIPAPVVTADGQSVPRSAAAQLEAARATLKQLRMRLTEDHPDIRKLSRVIKDLEQQASAEALEAPVSPGAPPTSPAEAVRVTQVSDLRAEEEIIKRRIAQKQNDEKRLLATMSAYRQRLEAAPAVEGQITELMRDYTTLQSAYQNLLAKSQEAKVSANVERRQIGEQFKIIDPPRMALRPTTPNRLRFNIMGILAGLGLGLGLAALVEYRDTSLRTEEDVVMALALPVVAFVPTMTTIVERMQRKRRKWLLASSAATVLLMTIAALAWKLKFFN
jgi:polysaccharide chain length determinant protein (PEP-CTERM system associated)